MTLAIAGMLIVAAVGMHLEGSRVAAWAVLLVGLALVRVDFMGRRPLP